MCIITYADAGKPCRGDADCEGRCLAEPGTGSAQGAPAKGICQADSNPCGCTTWVENGVVAGSICVD